jgi:hypothetical protein
MTNIRGNHPDDSSGTDTNTVVSQAKQRRSTTLAAITAIVDVVLAIIAGNFFSKEHRTIWVIVVIAVGVVAVGLQVITVQAESGGLIWNWRLVRRIIAGRAFIAIVAAALAGIVTYAVVSHIDKPQTPVAGPAASPSPTTGTQTPTSCRYEEGSPGVVPVVGKASAPDGMSFCPVLLNNGEPITGPFSVAGQFLAPANLLKNLVIVNQADPDTCDALGNKAVTGYFYARGMTVDADGSWSFRDGLGYDEAVTIGRNYMILSGSPAAIEAIKTDRDKYKGDNYAGMESLPGNAVVVGSFRQAPGKYNGKGSPCKNT